MNGSSRSWVALAGKDLPERAQKQQGHQRRLRRSSSLAMRPPLEGSAGAESHVDSQGALCDASASQWPLAALLRARATEKRSSENPRRVQTK